MYFDNSTVNVQHDSLSSNFHEQQGAHCDVDEDEEQATAAGGTSRSASQIIGSTSASSGVDSGPSLTSAVSTTGDNESGGNDVTVFPAAGKSSFDPAYFTSLLNEMEAGGGMPSTAIAVENDRDLARLFGTISTGLARADDWQARLTALVCIENVALGSAVQLESFVAIIKSMQELVRRCAIVMQIHKYCIVL